MKIISWNVNGLRACINKGFYEFFEKEKPDFFCIQETKMQFGQALIEVKDYTQYWNSAIKKGYSGTLIFALKKANKEYYGIDGKYSDEGRIITLEYNHFYLVCIYSPNSQEQLKRLDYRMTFEDDLNRYLNELKDKKNVIMCGDLNVAHERIDLKNPDSNVLNPGFSQEERNKFSGLLSTGFVDTFRYLYPNTIKYSWWSYRFSARLKNIGWRIDYFLVSDGLKDKVIDSLIYEDVLGSDHCPIGLIM